MASSLRQPGQLTPPTRLMMSLTDGSVCAVVKSGAAMACLTGLSLCLSLSRQGQDRQARGAFAEPNRPASQSLGTAEAKLKPAAVTQTPFAVRVVGSVSPCGSVVSVCYGDPGQKKGLQQCCKAPLFGAFLGGHSFLGPFLVDAPCLTSGPIPVG